MLAAIRRAGSLISRFATAGCDSRPRKVGSPQKRLLLFVGSSTRPVVGLTQCSCEHATHCTD
jgi:hypothetical protein